MGASEMWAHRVSARGQLDGAAREFEDYLQEYRIRVWEKGSGSGAGESAAWQYVVARNAARSDVRRLRRVPERVAIEDLPEISCPSEEKRLERCWFVGAVFRRMPERAAWVLAFWAYLDLSVVDLWERIGGGRSYSAIYAEVHRAIGMAREIAVSLL